MMTKKSFTFVAIAIAALSMVSCVDDRYDFDDVDMTVGTTGDLTLPNNSTGDILLGNIMDVTEDGVIQSVQGEYYLVEKGNANVPSINISPISIDRPVLSSLNAHIQLDKKNFLHTQSPYSMIGTSDFPNVPAATYTYTITPKDNAHYEIPQNTVGEVPSDIADIKEAIFVDGTKLDLHTNVSFGTGHDYISKIHFDNVMVKYPKGLKLQKAELIELANGKENIYPGETPDNENGTVVLTQDDRIVNTNSDIIIRLTFDKAVVGQDGVTFDGSKFKLDGLFEVNGSFRIESADFNKEMFTTEQIDAINATGSFDAICPQGVNMVGNASFEHDIYIKEFYGEVLTQVNDINPISLDDMPDFLNEPEVVLNLVNPVFYVEVNNPINGTLNTSLALISTYTDGTPNIRRASDNFILPAEPRSIVCIAENFENITIPEKYQGLTVVNVPVEGLSDLLTKLPDAIDVELDDVRINVDGMEIPQQGTHSYQVTIDYMVYTPLELGEGTTLIYKGVEENLSADMEDVNKLDTKAIEIKAVAETNFPLDLNLSVDAQDQNGISLVNNIVTVDDVIIPAHKSTEDCSYHNIALTIKPMEGHTIRQLLQQMDKFVYRAVAHGDGKLLDNAYIKLTKIKVTLKGGVSYDAN